MINRSCFNSTPSTQNHPRPTYMVADFADKLGRLRTYKCHKSEATMLVLRIVHFENSVLDQTESRKVLFDVVDRT